jgi:hypothetical protein
MGDPARHSSSGTQPTTVFRAQLGTAVARERGKKMLRAEKKAAVASLTDADVGRLVETFEALLDGPADVAALATDLHAALRGLSPDPAREENDHA